MYDILQGGGFTTGGLNFDAKVRRQSLDPADLFHAPHRRHGPVRARAARRRADDRRRRPWRASSPSAMPAGSSLGARVLAGKSNLAAVADHALARNVDQLPVSGRQEWLENWFNRFC